MGVELAGSCFPLSHPLLPHHPSSPQTIASVFSSSSSSSSSSSINNNNNSNKRRRRRWDSSSIVDHSYLAFHPLHHPSAFLGASSARSLSRRSRSCDITTGGEGRWRMRPHTRATLHDNKDDDEDEEFIIRLQQLATNLDHQDSEIRPDSRNRQHPAVNASAFSSHSPPILRLKQHHLPSTAEPPWPPAGCWPEEVMVAASLERRASSVDLPVSLRMIKKKKKKGKNGCGGPTSDLLSSVKRAFSSMVFIIREIQSYTLQMREILFLEDLQGILERVQGEMHASFVWLFQHIFACTPTLMLSLMLLLANYTVHSMAHAAVQDPPPTASASATVIANEDHRFDASSLKTFSSVGGKTASVGGGGSGGGGNTIPVAGGMGDSQSGGGNRRSPSLRTTTTPTDEEEVEEVTVTVEEVEDESIVWNRIVEEASRMQKAEGREEVLMDHEILQRLVSPVTVAVEAEDESAYLQTELMYHQALSQDPNNTTLLSNFAQFLYLVLHDHDRAEYYFKRAARSSEPADAEALSRYASFLWLARKDIGEAEEMFLEAIAADPTNTFHAANYAHFLWNTGGEDTCYPLS